ncbi:hypothetical protein [Streptomyces sp. NPDC051211]|uniref:hypothetical protein n=1 Tax=Streptomyces sp. NPDC051211 TaxID=3154643 RepID=UPI00344BDCB2
MTDPMTDPMTNPMTAPLTDPRHPLHVALAVPVYGGAAAAGAGAVVGRARHRRPSTVLPAVRTVVRAAVLPPARRLAAGLGLASVLAATVLTAALDPSAPVAPDRVPAGESSSLAQETGD